MSPERPRAFRSYIVFRSTILTQDTRVGHFGPGGMMTVDAGKNKTQIKKQAIPFKASSPEPEQLNRFELCFEQLINWRVNRGSVGPFSGVLHFHLHCPHTHTHIGETVENYATKAAEVKLCAAFLFQELSNFFR